MATAGIAFLATWLGIIIFGMSKKLSLVISVGGGFIAACVVAIALSPGKPAAEKDNSAIAYTMVESFVEKRLKSPASAKFPGIFDGREKHVTALGNKTYLIMSYVDSQNSFGANIRTYFVAEIKQVSEDKWQLISLQFRQ